jgi:hypothetical protein
MEIQLVQNQLEENRRSVAFDSYDITVRQLYDMVVEGIIDIAPEYQRHFVWQADRQSALIESLYLGIPVPSLFMATNKDSTWEVIDGLQRLMTLVNYVGRKEDQIDKIEKYRKKLVLSGLEKLTSLNGSSFEELPKTIQLKFLTRPVKITVLNDRSDFDVRYDLFERLNTGGITLHPQEIRNCIYIGKFKDFLIECSKNPDYKSVVNISRNSKATGISEELVLKFFGYYEDREKFVHGVKDFLNDYMEKKTKKFVKEDEYRVLFNKTFKMLNDCLPEGIKRGNKKATPLILFEAISIGVADLIQSGAEINCANLVALLDNEELKKLTTGATNSRVRLNKRINFVKENLV